MTDTPEVHRVNATLRRPTGPDDPGAVLPGFYIVARGNTVVLTDQSGTPLKRERTRLLLRRGEPEEPPRWERTLRPGEDANRAARQLLMEKHRSEKRGGPQRINYPPLGNW
jgi:hypothetical protein